MSLLDLLFKTKQATKAAFMKTSTAPVIETYTITDFDTSAVSTYSVGTTFSSPTSDEGAAIERKKTEKSAKKIYLKQNWRISRWYVFFNKVLALFISFKSYSILIILNIVES